MRPLVPFIAASGLANLADGVAVVAWAWIGSLLTRDPLLVALLPVALRLPWFVFAIPAGLITDRGDRRLLILRADILRAGGFAVCAAGVALSLPLPPAPDAGLAAPGLFALLLIAAFVIGTAEVLRDNAAQTMLPALVAPADLERANGRLWSVELTGNALLGPALGAMLIAVAVPLPLALNAAAFAVAAVLIARLPGTFRPPPRARDWRAELHEGFAFLRDHALLRRLAWITGSWNLLHQMTVIALVLHAQENLGLSAPAYGLMLAAGAAGGILGGLTGDGIVRRLGAGRAAQWTLAVSAPAFALMAVAPGPVTLALTLAVFEFAGLVWNTVSVAYRQRTIPDRLLGRVNSLYRLLAWGMMPLGLVLSGLSVRAAESVLPRAEALVSPFLLAAAGAAVLSAATWAALGRGFATPSHQPR